jgi:hypothetical protein
MRKRPLAALLLLAACSTNPSEKAAATNYRQEAKVDDVTKLAYAEAQPAPPAGTEPGDDHANRPTRGAFAGLDGKSVVDNRKIVRTGNIDLVVKTYDDTRDKIDAIVKEAGGFVDSTRVSRSEGQVSSAVIVVRVPAGGFGDLLPKLRALGDIQQESTDAADITAEYVDTSARLTSAHALEKRLIELAGSRTGTVAEVLEVERELARVRGEIEQLEGQMRVWNDQVSLSTLTISLATQRPEIAAAAEPGFNRRVSMAWHASLDALGNAAQGLSIALIALLPWLPLLLPALYFGIRALRRRIRLPQAVVYSMVAPHVVHAAPGEAPVPPGQGDVRAP